MRRRWKWLILPGALLAAAAGGALWWREGTLPDLAGRLAVSGLGAPVVIEREPSGIVHIRAQSDRDLVFAQGLVHAQDRLWQMELQRRLGAGRLAEVLGPEAVDRDRYLRTWGFRRAAEAAYAALGEEARGLVDAYAAGVNAWIAGDPPLPPEFRLLGIRPEPWEPADVVVWAKLMAYNLADNRRAELTRYRLLARGLTPERIAELMPLYPGEQASGATPAAGSVDPARDDLERLLAMDARVRQHLPQASNNWVVGGERTASGLPLLATDVHLGMQLPAAWHLVHLASPGLDVIGASLPGLPLVLIGRNPDIAWGVTNLAADVEDLYVIEEAEGGYRHRGEVRPFTEREEVIAVRGGEPVRIRVRSTLYGPVVSDVVDNPAGALPLALRWTGHDPDDTTMEAFLGINRARGWQELLAALERYVVPGQNFVYADRTGRIGYAASGRVPVRRPGHSGLYPVPGDGDWDWLGTLPARDMPRREAPAEGFVVTANHRITPPGYPHRLSLEWGAEPYRAARITELIEATPRHDAASMRRMQQDTVTLLHRDLRPVLSAMTPETLPGRRWRLRLLHWNADAAADSPESTVFHAWYAELATLPAEETGVTHWHTHPRYLIRALTQGDPACDRRGTTCLAFAARALDRVMEQLGEEPPAWGTRHQAHLAHSVLTHTPLARLSDRRVGMGGSHYTVNVGWYEPGTWTMFHGATYRQVIDLADPEASVFVLAGGQSGNWLDPHYADQVPLWQAGEYLPMRREGYTVDRRLELVPAPADQAGTPPRS